MTEPFTFNASGQLVEDEDEERRRAREEAERLAGAMPELDAISVPAPSGSEPARDEERAPSLPPAGESSELRRDTGPGAFSDPVWEVRREIEAERRARDEPRAPDLRSLRERIRAARSNTPTAQPAAPVTPPSQPAPRAASYAPSTLAAMAGGGEVPRALARAEQPSQQAPSPQQAPPSGETSDRAARLAARLATMIQEQRPAPGPQAAGPDYTGVDIADAVVSPLRGLARGLMAAGGVPGDIGPTWGQQARARNAAAAGQALAATESQAQQRQADEALALRREQMEGRREDREQDRSLDALRLRLQAARDLERTDIARQRADATMRRADLQAAQMQDEQARRAALTDPTSQPSQTARVALRTALAGYRPEAQERLREQLGVESLEQAIGPEGRLNAQDARELMGALPRMFRDIQHRRGGAGRGGGGEALQQRRAALATPPDGWGGSDEQWAALPADERVRVVRNLGQQGRFQADEVVPGSGIRFGGSVRAAEADEIRDGLAAARGQMAAIGQIDDVVERYGSQAAIDPRVEADLVGPTQAMMAMVATLRNTGIINPGEAPTIEAAIPNPRSMRQAALGEYERRAESFRRLMDERVRATLQSRGVDEHGVGRVLRWLRSGGSLRASRAAPRAGRYRIPGRDEPSPMLTAEQAARLMRRYPDAERVE